MIVVVGQPLYRETDAGVVADGPAALIAIAAAARGRSVQLVGKVGEDDAGDAVLLALAGRGVGHVTVLRDPGRPTPRLPAVRDLAIDGDDGRAEPVTLDDQPSPPAGADDGPTLEAADVDLALRYLTEFAVLVLAERVDPATAAGLAAATSWADARLVVVVPAGEAEPPGLPPEAIVFESPDADEDGVFAAMVGAFAAALDDGEDPGVAFRASVDSAGWTPATPE